MFLLEAIRSQGNIFLFLSFSLVIFSWPTFSFRACVLFFGTMAARNKKALSEVANSPETLKLDPARHTEEDLRTSKVSLDHRFLH